MARYRLGVAMGVDGPATHPIRQTPPAVAAADPVDRGVRQADAVAARQVPDDPDRPEMVGPPPVEDLVDDFRARRLRMGSRDRAPIDQPCLAVTLKGSPPDVEQGAGDPQIPARLPDIPALCGVLPSLLLATDIALSVGHDLPASWGDIGCPTRSVMSTAIATAHFITAPIRWRTGQFPGPSKRCPLAKARRLPRTIGDPHGGEVTTVDGSARFATSRGDGPALPADENDRRPRRVRLHPVLQAATWARAGGSIPPELSVRPVAPARFSEGDSRAACASR